MEHPLAASSAEDESTSSGDVEEDGSSAEEHQPQSNPQRNSSSLPPHKSPTKQPDSDSDSDSDSGTESDFHSEDSLDPTVKAIACKPMYEIATKSKPSVSAQVSEKSTAKRDREVERDVRDSKRSKKKEHEVIGNSQDTKKQLFQRLWSEKDEIALLKGIIDFTQKKRIDPAKDMTSFHDFIKKSVHFDLALSQLKDKVSRLKKKFENQCKGRKGEYKTFSKTHDQEAFDLSKKIWGSEGICVQGAESSAKAVENHPGLEVAAIVRTVFDKSVGVAGMGNYVVQRGLDMVDGAKKAEMEENWRRLHVAELELFLKRNELIREQAKLMLAAYKD